MKIQASGYLHRARRLVPPVQAERCGNVGPEWELTARQLVVVNCLIAWKIRRHEGGLFVILHDSCLTMFGSLFVSVIKGLTVRKMCDTLCYGLVVLVPATSLSFVLVQKESFMTILTGSKSHEQHVAD